MKCYLNFFISILISFTLYLAVVITLNYAGCFKYGTEIYVEFFSYRFAFDTRAERHVPQSAMLKSQINWPALKKQPAGRQASRQSTHTHTFVQSWTLTVTDRFSKCTPVHCTHSHKSSENERTNERPNERTYWLREWERERTTVAVLAPRQANNAYLCKKHWNWTSLLVDRELQGSGGNTLVAGIASCT